MTPKELLRVRGLHDLIELRAKRRAVVCPSARGFRGPLPAAFVLNLSGESLYRLLEIEGMYMYTGEKKAKGDA